MTPEQELAFAMDVVAGHPMLESALEWIASNLEPGDVFEREKLEAWAVAAGYEKKGE
jgi:hypothetical protein